MMTKIEEKLFQILTKRIYNLDYISRTAQEDEQKDIMKSAERLFQQIANNPNTDFHDDETCKTLDQIRDIINKEQK